MRPKAVEQLAQMLDVAHETGLDVQVDVLQGHLSSFDFYPSWVQTWHRRNIFVNTEVISGQRFYIRTLAEALKDKPNFLGFTLGNEVNLLTESNPCTPEQAAEWIDTLLAGMREGRSRTPARALRVRRRLVRERALVPA